MNKESIMIVVTGATGNVGRPLVRILAEAGERVTAVSRTETSVPDGVVHRKADLTDTETLRPVFEGADALFLLTSGANAHLLNMPDILDAAKSAGIGRIVLLSSQGVATRPESESHGRLGRSIENAIEQSSMEWTFLRPGGFNTNRFAWAGPIREHRTTAAPFGDVGLPTIDPYDIAAVASAALREDGHAAHIYTLTGPALVTPREQARAIGDALGEPIRFVEQSRDEARAQMLESMPEPVVETTLDILGRPTQDEQRVSPDVEQVLGRPARTFADWARRNTAAFTG
jgi:uncharacterized protein YbjT (DUF2867 family)